MVNRLRNLVDIERKVLPDLSYNRSKQTAHLVEFFIILGKAVDATKTDTLEQLIAPCPYRLVIYKTDIWQHVCEVFFFRDPCWQQ